MYTVVVQVTIQSRVKRKKNADESLRYHEGPTRLRCSVTGLPPVPGALPSVGFSRFASESLAGAPVSSRARFPAAPMIDTPPWLEGPASEEAAAALPRMLSPRPAPWPRPLPGAPEARGAAEASDGLRGRAAAALARGAPRPADAAVLAAGAGATGAEADGGADADAWVVGAVGDVVVVSGMRPLFFHCSICASSALTRDCARTS